jgi:hypothetical protein
MISAREWILVSLKSRMNSVRHSLNSESMDCQCVFGKRVLIGLTHYRLKAVLPIDGQTCLARQLNRVDNVDAHFDHTLYHHIVLLELGPSQHCMTPTDAHPCTVRRIDVHGTR